MRFRDVDVLTPPFAKGGRGGICKVPAGATVAEIPPNPPFAKGGMEVSHEASVGARRLPPLEKGGGGGFADVGVRAGLGEIPPNPPLEKGGIGTLDDWRRTLLSRRSFLLASAGGLAALFAPAGTLAATANPWLLLAATQNHLFPSELGAPGAREINALSYLQQVLGDPHGDREEQRFILKGVDWLEDLSRQRQQTSFVDLDPIRREQVLREVANSRPGENWLSTLLLYICEALLTDPVYGGNPEGIGWTWLGHQPGFPRPTPEKRYGVLK